MKLFLSLFLAAITCVPVFGQKITAPAEVKVAVGRLGPIPVLYDGVGLEMIVPEELDLIRVYSTDPKDVQLRVQGWTPGTYKLYFYTATDKGILSKPATVVVNIVDPAPGPTPGPGPGPNPPPPPPVPPIPAGDLRVLFIYETSGNLSQGQMLIINSTKLRAYLREKCVKENGVAAFRFLDKDTPMNRETKLWQDLWRASEPATGYPKMVVFKGTNGTSYALPDSEDAVLAILNKYTGN